MKLKDETRKIALVANRYSDSPVAIIEINGTREFRRFLGSVSKIMRAVGDAHLKRSTGTKLNAIRKSLEDSETVEKGRFIVHLDHNDFCDDDLYFACDGVIDISLHMLSMSFDGLEIEEELEISGGEELPFYLDFELCVQKDGGFDYANPWLTYYEFCELSALLNEGIDYYLVDKDNGKKAYILVEGKNLQRFTLGGKSTEIWTCF